MFQILFNQLKHLIINEAKKEEKMMAKKQYYKRLDIIRNVSCIMVLLYHLNILPGGFLAVCTFFTLSGYLTCMSALKKEKFSIKSYYINRIKTLYLPLLIVVFLTIIFSKLIPNIIWLNLKKETLSVIFGYNNFWQLKVNQDYFTKNLNSPFIHLWYISILMQFELIFPLIFSLFKKYRGKNKENIIAIAIIAVTIVTTVFFIHMSSTKDIMVVYYNTFSRIFSIFFGILLALIQFEYGTKLPRFLKTNNSFIYTMYMIIFILLSIFVSAQSKYFALFMILVTLISARMIKYSTIQINTKKSNRITKFFANISYEIYLVQYPIIYFMQNLPLNRLGKIFLLIILTIISAIIVHILLNFRTKNKTLKAIKKLILGIIIIAGVFLVITEKDHTAEMKELEEVLNENTDVIEQKNEDFINNKNIQENAIVETKPETAVTETKQETAITETNPESKIKEETQIDNNKTAEKVGNLPVVGIGDSVLLGAIKELYKKFPNGYFDGKVSRNLSAGETILKDLKNKGKLTNIVILSLANNGEYSTKKNKQLMEIIGDRELYWVNAVGADDPTFNEKFREFAKDYSNIHIVEWDEVSKNHPEYFYADGIHPKGTGVKKYAEIIYNAVFQDYSLQSR